jgi:uridine monophosphate synthetase
MVSNTEIRMKNLALKLFEISAFKFGDFKMKVGVNSPVYFDLRVIVSHPEVMVSVKSLRSID